MGLASLCPRYGLIGWADINGVLIIELSSNIPGTVGLLLGWSPPTNGTHPV